MTETSLLVGAGADVFQLLHRAEQRAKTLFAQETENVDLTLRQTEILKAIKDGGTVIQSDIVQATGIDRSTVTELMGRMNAKGLITRSRNRRDARAYLVTITDLGLELLESAQSASSRAAEHFIEALPVEARQPFLESLRAAAGVGQNDPSKN